MEDGNWILLNEYSAKYRVSPSTVRRRIKNGQIEYRLSFGKYYIMDLPVPKMETVPIQKKPSVRVDSQKTKKVDMQNSQEALKCPF